jgi:tRNA dimethylallyltransferase
MLKNKDPERAQSIDRQNKVRLIRALEIVAALGKVPRMRRPGAALQPARYHVLWLGLKVPKTDLHTNIHIRLFARIRAGMIAEAKLLHARGLSWKRMEELGLEYRYLARYLQGRTTKEAMLGELETKIRQYAKRQRRWFKKNKYMKWFLPADKKTVFTLVKAFVKHSR